MKLGKRNRIRLYSLTIAAFVVSTVFAVTGHIEANNYRRQLESSYLRSLQELSESVAALSTDLNKSIYVSTPNQLTHLSSRMSRQATVAKTALSALPLEQNSLSNTYRFLSQVGDYSAALAQKLSNGERLDTQERKHLLVLLDYAADLNRYIGQLQSEVSAGVVSIYDLARVSAAAANPDESPEAQVMTNYTDGVKEFENSFESYPKLIYDGPFSDGLIDRVPDLVKNGTEISKEEARRKAAAAVKTDISNVKYLQDENSNIPSYCFEANTTSIIITKHRGLLSGLLNPREVGDPTIKPEEAKEIGMRYMAELGATGMQPTYYEISHGICVINYAYAIGETICYPDLIKVGVALDNGEVVFYDARSYIVNHKARKLADPLLTPGEATSNLSPNLKSGPISLALIPTAGGNEILTYEIKCKGIKDENVLVYRNVLTGQEEQVLILIESETGQLTV